jgi:hypothetical protein
MLMGVDGRRDRPDGRRNWPSAIVPRAIDCPSGDRSPPGARRARHWRVRFEAIDGRSRQRRDQRRRKALLSDESGVLRECGRRERFAGWPSGRRRVPSRSRGSLHRSSMGDPTETVPAKKSFSSGRPASPVPTALIRCVGAGPADADRRDQSRAERFCADEVAVPGTWRREELFRAPVVAAGARVRGELSGRGRAMSAVGDGPFVATVLRGAVHPRGAG